MENFVPAENFMPRGLSEVKLGPDWSVVGITAIDNNQKIRFKVMGGELEKLSTRQVVPDNRFELMNRQVRKIADEYEKRAELARELKKPNWTFDLEKYGVIIKKDGCLSISRWMTKKDNTRELIWQTLQDIKSAIRQQDHIIEEYLDKKSGLQNDQEISSEFSNLFKQLSVILPHIEIRRLLLIRAQEQMDLSIRQTEKGLEKILTAKGKGREKYHGLPKRLERMAFYLNNSYPNPYRAMADQILPLIKGAKKSATLWQWDKTELLLLNVEKILMSGDKTIGRQSRLIGISEIDPIRILAEVDRYNLADEVMAMAKKFLTEPPYYYEKLGLFRLSAMLAISQLVIEGRTVSREAILKLLN